MAHLEADTQAFQNLSSKRPQSQNSRVYKPKRETYITVPILAAGLKYGMQDTEAPAPLEAHA